MEAEADPFVKHLSLENDETFFPSTTPFLAFRGRYKNCDVTVVTNGKDNVYGKENIQIIFMKLCKLSSLTQRFITDNSVGTGVDNVGTADTTSQPTKKHDDKEMTVVVKA